MSTPEEPQYKPGDVANGYQLHTDNQWRPYVPPKPERKWFLRKRVLIPAAVLVFIIIVGSINRAPATDATAGTGAGAGAVEAPAAEAKKVTVPDVAGMASAAAIAALQDKGFHVENIVDLDSKIDVVVSSNPRAGSSVAEGTTVTLALDAKPEVGTLKNPAPAGSTIDGTYMTGATYSVKPGAVNADANQLIHDTNQFNDVAAPGYHYILVNITVTNTSTDAAAEISPMFVTHSMQVTDATGKAYEQKSVVLDTDVPYTDIYSGQTAAGDLVFMVADGATGLMLSSGGVFVSLGL